MGIDATGAFFSWGEICMGPTPAEEFTALGALPPDVGEWCFSPTLLLGGICKGAPPQWGLMQQVRFFPGEKSAWAPPQQRSLPPWEHFPLMLGSDAAAPLCSWGGSARVPHPSGDSCTRCVFFPGSNLHGPHPSRGVYLLGSTSPWCWGVMLQPRFAPGGICKGCLLYTSPSPRDQRGSRMPSSA